MRHVAVGLAIVLAWLGCNGTLHAASFNCNQELSPVERMICTDDTLGAADESLAQAYSDLRGVAPEQIADQRQWIEQRNQCADVECVSALYLDRIEELEQRLTRHRRGVEASPPDTTSTAQFPAATPSPPTNATAPSAAGVTVDTTPSNRPMSVKQKIENEQLQLAALGFVLFMAVIVILGGMRKIVICYDLKDFAWSFGWVLALIGSSIGASMLYPEGQTEPTLTGMIVTALMGMTALACIVMVFVNAIRYNRSIVVGVIVGTFKLIFGLAFVILVWGAIQPNHGRRGSGGSFALLAILALVFYGLYRATINGPEVYQQKGWPEPA